MRVVWWPIRLLFLVWPWKKTPVLGTSRILGNKTHIYFSIDDASNPNQSFIVFAFPRGEARKFAEGIILQCDRLDLARAE